MWSAIRSEFPIVADRTYLFAGGMAPLSAPGRAAIEAYADVWGSNSARAYREYPGEEAALLREEVATLIGAQARDIAILDSTSRGNNLAVQMIEAVPGSNVVMDSTTYPTAHYPWLMRQGVEVRIVDGVEPSVEQIRRLVDERTLAISVSHVCRLTGFRHGIRVLADIAHSVGAVLIIDAAQSVGVVPIDVGEEGVDFLSFGAMKWMLGCPGVAFFYVRPSLQEDLVTPHVSGGSRIEGLGIVFPDGGARHELSSFNWLGVGASLAGLNLLRRASPVAVEARVLELSGLVIEGLRQRGVSVRTPVDERRRAGIVAFVCDSPNALTAALRAQAVDVWGWEERGLVRVDPHIYNDEQDIERFFAAYDRWQLSDN